MKSGTCRSATESVLKPSAGLAISAAVLAVLALGAVWASGIALPAALALTAAIAATAAVRIRMFLRPRLSLRVMDDRIEYRNRAAAPWTRLPPGARCFASPWFIGWRDRRWRAQGVFWVQLNPEDFRRILVVLRHQSAD